MEQVSNLPSRELAQKYGLDATPWPKRLSENMSHLRIPFFLPALVSCFFCVAIGFKPISPLFFLEPFCRKNQTQTSVCTAPFTMTFRYPPRQDGLLGIAPPKAKHRIWLPTKHHMMIDRFSIMVPPKNIREFV